MSAALQLEFKRVQFAPDAGRRHRFTGLRCPHRQFVFRRARCSWCCWPMNQPHPPKTQAALLEAMEERQVSVEGEPKPLPNPFIVAATQNPIE